MSFSDNYPIITVPSFLSKSFFDMDKNEAEKYFKWFIEQIDYRDSILKKNITNCNLDYTRESFSCLYNCLNKKVSYRKMTDKEITKESEKIVGRLKGNINIKNKILTNETISICFDVGIYLAESIKKASKGVYWSFEASSKKYINYAQPVLKKKGVKVEFNPKNTMEIIARQIIEKRAKDTALIDLYDIWIKFFGNGTD